MSKWDVRKLPKQVTVKRKVDPVNRVVPPLLARIPDIADWLYRDTTINMSTRIAYDLKKAYRTINELIKQSIENKNF